MNLYEFCNIIIVWLVDLVNNLWYWLGDFFTGVGNLAASDGHIAVMTSFWRCSWSSSSLSSTSSTSSG